MKSFEPYILVALFIGLFKVLLTFKTVDEIDHLDRDFGGSLIFEFHVLSFNVRSENVNFCQENSTAIPCRGLFTMNFLVFFSDEVILPLN